MAHIEDQDNTESPFVAALNKALDGEPDNVKLAAIEAANKAFTDPDVIQHLAANVLKSEPVMAKITKAAQDYAREIVQKKTKETDDQVADLKTRIAQVEMMAKSPQPQVRRPEPNPMGAHYRQMAAHTDDTALRRGYEQLAAEHDTRSVN
jgi:hypothetical protein